MYSEFNDNYGYSSDEIQGGELAASFSPAVRMEMIQRGYDPMNPADVRAYKNRQKPQGGLSEVAGVETHKSLGDHGTFIDGKYVGYTDKRDYGILAKEGKDVVDYDSLNSNVDPRQMTTRSMDGYGGSFGDDVNDRLMAKINARREAVQTTTQRVPQQRQVAEQPVRTKGPISQPKQIQQKAQPQLLTEATKAKQLGFTKGCKYINAFIENIKNPNSQNRENLIMEMNRMVAVEEKIHPSVLQHYRNGIAQAEAEMYKKIKSR